MPDSTLSTAIKEAYASAPSDSTIMHTLEIWHPNFDVPIRVVRDYVAIDARLEAGAPRNAGEVVNFLAFAFDITPPDVGPTSIPQCVIEIDNVSRAILANIELAMTGHDPITVIYRAFLSSTLTVGPETDPPLQLTVITISADTMRIRATCGFPNLANKRFPGIDYTAEVFPGLIPS